MRKLLILSNFSKKDICFPIFHIEFNEMKLFILSLN